MRITGPVLLAGLLCMPSPGFGGEEICVTLSGGERITCEAGDKCVNKPSGVGLYMAVGNARYQCMKTSGVSYIPQYREKLTAPAPAPAHTSSARGTAPASVKSSYNSFRPFAKPVPSAKAAPAAVPDRRVAAAQARPERSQAEILRDAGNAYYAKQDLENAVSNWEKAKTLDPGLKNEIAPRLADAYARRGVLRLRRGDLDGAIYDLDEAHNLDPKDLTFLKARDLAYKKRFGAAKADAAPVGAPARAPAPESSGRPAPSKAPAADAAPEKTAAEGFGPLWAVWSVILWLLWCASFWIGASLTAEGIRNAPGLAPRARKWRAVNGFFASLAAAYFTVSLLFLLFRALGVPFSVTAAAFTYKWILPLACLAVVIAAVYVFALVASQSPGSSAVLAKTTGIKMVKVSKPASKADQVILERAKELLSGKQYEEALKALSKKPFDQLDPDDMNLFLDLYIKAGDFSRAKLTLNRIREAVEDYPELVNEYAYYLSLVPACKEKGEAVMAFRLRETGAEFMLKALSVADAPKDIYSLAKEMEKEGESGLAMTLYQAFVRAGYQYLDAEERFRELKARPAAPPEAKARKQEPAVQTGRGSHLLGLVLDGRYQIRGGLGEGAMGVVYEGWDLKSARKVAIKRMHSWLKSYPEEYGRFKKEAEIVGRLKHPNIVGVNAVIEQAGEIFLVFDFIEGRPLSDILRERRRIPLADCLNIFKGVCEAVHYAHGKNVIHRDLKLANVMVDGAGHAMVVDFGLASELRDSLTRVSHQTMSGTPAYMAPEQYAGVVKRESDVYAIGVCLYELLTGELPFQGNDPLKQKKEKDYRDVSSMLPWLPAGIDGLLARALEPEPSQRIADALEFFDALKRL